MSSKVAILIAIIIGAVAAVFIHNYLGQQERDEAGEFITVIQVVRTIPAGGKLSSNSVEEVDIPRYAYSKNMQVTRDIFRDYRGRAVKNQCDKGKFLTMADLAVALEPGTKIKTGDGYMPLSVNIKPDQLFGLSEGSSVMILIQEPIRYTSGITTPKTAQAAFRHTLIVDLTVLGFGTKKGFTNSSVPGVSSVVYLKVPIKEAIAIRGALNQYNKNTMIFPYDPADDTINTDEVLIEFETKTNSPKEIRQELNKIFKSGMDED